MTSTGAQARGGGSSSTEEEERRKLPRRQDRSSICGHRRFLILTFGPRRVHGVVADLSQPSAAAGLRKHRMEEMEGGQIAGVSSE